ncbi:MAG: phosphatidylinositol-specific phospholipase C/glycerophosphodiester phosphodiesterase family protein [Gemmatimonadaceae bacterium]
MGAVTLAGAAGAQVVAHAHNDYEHARPLLDALEHGFTSIEADVYLVDGQLLVAHARDSVVAGRTLESMYLAPLREHVQRTGATKLILLIDVKQDAEGSWVVLDSLLRRYADMLTIYAGGDVREGAVTAIISGERAISTMRRQRMRFAGVDGRIADLAAKPRASRVLMPLVSDSWERIIKSGKDPRREVERVVALAHANEQRVRFWATPDDESLWQMLVGAGVDLIGTDDLPRLQAFLGLRPRP